MAESLLGLGHDVVVGSDDDDDDVGHLGTAGTHSGKRSVARGVEEGDATAVLQLHGVGTDVLSDTASLAGYDVGVADVVEQRSLTVVNVTHDGNHWWTFFEIFGVVHLIVDSLGNFGTGIFGLETELLGHDIDGLSVETHVDGNHHAQAHTCADDLVHGNVHHGCEVVGSHKLGEFEHLLFGCFHCCHFALFLAHGITFLTTPLGGLLWSLGCKACKRLLYLTLYVFLTDFGFERPLSLLLLAFAIGLVG